MKTIKDKTFDEERALYGSDGLDLENVSFDGQADGESALKESRNIIANNCFFNLRYPLWHVDGAELTNCEMTEFCRAAIWYSKRFEIKNTAMHGIKALRECANVEIEDCDIVSPEFGWSVDNITMINSNAKSEYFMMRSQNIKFDNVQFEGKYSFQYIKNATFTNCNFNTKDAFWHGENILVENSVIKGEYLAWYSKNLVLKNCTIIGTQPFCYCDGLKLVDCKMIDTDLSFEKSNVEATVLSNVVSIKNPYSGKIVVDSVGEIILDDSKAKAEIIVKNKLI